MKTSTLALCALITLATGCAREPSAAATQITGTISYRTPIDFEAGATLQLRLSDVSVSDGPALTIANITIADLQALPYQYALPYDANKIDPQHRYTVDARILTENKLRFSTDTAYGVLTQGSGAQRNIEVIAIGGNEPTATRDLNSQPNASVFRNELRTAQEVSLYQAGMQDGHILWLEEDRSNGTPQALHARYEFKGALILRYVDTSPLEVNFDVRGRPTGIVKNRQALKLGEQTELINAIRNRAELLRSHALAANEAKSHRQAPGG